MRKILYILLSINLPYTAVAGKKETAGDSEHSESEEEKSEGRKKKLLVKAEKSETKEKPSITFREKVEQLKQNIMTEDRARKKMLRLLFYENYAECVYDFMQDRAWEMREIYQQYESDICSCEVEVSPLFTRINGFLGFFSDANIDKTAIEKASELCKFSKDQYRLREKIASECPYIKKILDDTLDINVDVETGFTTYEGVFTTLEKVDTMFGHHIKVLTEGLEELNQILEESILADQLNALSIEESKKITSELGEIKKMLEDLTIEKNSLIKKSQFPDKDHQ